MATTTAPSKVSSISFLGLGLMGNMMCKRLIDKSKWKITVWTRDHSKLKKFQEENPICVAVHKPNEAISNSDVSIIMLTDGKAIGSVLLTEESKKTTSKQGDHQYNHHWK